MISTNVRLFYILEALLSAAGGIILPVYVFYFRNYDITLFQVAVLAVAFEATIIVFELPTGVLADRFGRKASTLTGFALMAVSGLVFFHFKSFTGFLVAEVVFGLAETFISGALEALAVDSLPGDKKDSILAALYARRTAVKNGALLIGMIAGGWLAGVMLPLLFLPVTFLALGGFVVAFFLSEPGIKPGRLASDKKDGSLLKTIFTSRAILALFVVGLLANVVYEPVDQFWQVLFAEIRGVDVSLFGFITAVGLIAVVILAGPVRRMYNRPAFGLLSGFLIMAGALYLSTRDGQYPAIAGIVVYFILKELIRPVLATQLNKRFDGSRRATYLSAFNLTCSVGEVAAGLLAGVLASWYGVITLFHFAAAGAVVVPLIYLLISKRKI